jgi:hypothetical protein
MFIFSIQNRELIEQSQALLLLEQRDTFVTYFVDLVVIDV